MTATIDAKALFDRLMNPTAEDLAAAEEARCRLTAEVHDCKDYRAQYSRWKKPHCSKCHRHSWSEADKKGRRHCIDCHKVI